MKLRFQNKAARRLRQEGALKRLKVQLQRGFRTPKNGEGIEDLNGGLPSVIVLSKHNINRIKKEISILETKLIYAA